MALKDWKRFETGNGQYVKLNSYAEFGGYGVRLEIKEYRGRFIVRKNARGFDGWYSVKIGDSKSKSIALKLAKEYMSKH